MWSGCVNSFRAPSGWPFSSTHPTPARGYVADAMEVGRSLNLNIAVVEVVQDDAFPKHLP
jgi:hypothetical protein